MLTVTDLTKLLAAEGLTVSRRSIKNWVSQGWLECSGSFDGSPLFGPKDLAAAKRLATRAQNLGRRRRDATS